MTLPPANWYADPQDAASLRYWDGTAWTGHTHPKPQPTPQPAPQATFQPTPQATFQPAPQPAREPAPRQAFQPQAPAQFQPQSQQTFQSQAQQTFQPQAQFQPQPQAQSSVEPGTTTWSPGATFSPGPTLSAGQGAAPALMPAISRPASASGLHTMTPGAAPTIGREFTPYRSATLGTPTMIAKRRGIGSSRLAIFATVAAVTLVYFLSDGFGMHRALTVSDVVAPPGWEVRTSPSGAIAYAFDPEWVDATAFSTLPAYREDQSPDGLQLTEVAAIWAREGTPNSPKTGLMVVAKSLRKGPIDAKASVQAWMKQDANEFGDASPTVVTNEAFVSDHGYDGWRMVYSLKASGNTLYTEEIIIANSDAALVVTCYSIGSTAKWEDDLLAVVNSAVIMGAVTQTSGV